MARIKLYCDKLYEENERSFESAQFDLNITADLFQKDLSSEEYNKPFEAEIGYTYNNPKTGTPGRSFGINVRSNGMKYINLDSADEILKCPTLEVTHETNYTGAKYNPEYSSISPTSELATIFPKTVYNEYSQTSGFKAVQSWTSNTPPNNPIMFPNGYGSRHFYTMAGFYFALKHVISYYPYTGSSPGAVTYGYNTANIFSALNSRQYPDSENFMRYGVNGEKLGNGFSKTFCNDNYYTNVAGMIFKSHFKQFLITGTLPIGTPVWEQSSRTYKPTEQAYDIIGVMNVEYSTDNIPLNAWIGAFTLDAWIGDESGGYWGENSGIEGGEGSFKTDSDNIPSDKVQSGAREKNSNRLNIFSMSDNGFHLYSDFSLSDLMSQLMSSGFIDRFLQSQYNPMSAVLSIHTTPEYYNNSEIASARFSDTTIKLSGYDTKVNTRLQNDSIRTIDCGFLDLSNTYFGAFPDYAPYTKITLNLPFCGKIDISPSLCMGGGIKVVYNIDLINGNICAIVVTTDRLGVTYPAYSVTGNCAYTYPLVGQQGGDVLGKILSNVIPSLGGSQILDLPSKMTGIIYDSLTTSHHTQITGTVSGNVSLLDDWTIYAEISRPQWINNTEFINQIGIPSGISGTINANSSDNTPFSGYLKCRSIDVTGITGATDSELSEIERLLTNGIFI